MGKRGPRKQPTKLRLLRGDPRKEGKKPNEPQPTTANVVPPDWLSGVALEKWHQIAPMMESMGVLTDADVDALARYCAMHEQFLKYLDQVRRGLDVLVIRDEAGKVKYMQVAPAATLLSKTAAAMLRLEQEFGLTPSSRSGIEVMNGSAKDSNPLTAFGITS